MRIVLTLPVLLLVCLVGCQAEHEGEANMSETSVDSLWNYGDPAGTRAQFETMREDVKAAGDDQYLQLQTQIARTYSLEAKFDEAHEILDSVEQALPEGDSIARVRYLLERGRTFNSAGMPETANALFKQAYEMGKRLEADFYTVDAAHMVAIAVSDPEDQMAWNQLAVQVADASEDPRARNWRGSLLNNMGWTLHDQQKYDEALAMFEQALEVRREQGDERSIRIAKWCVARCLRSLDRIDSALAIQQELYALAEADTSGASYGYTYEELGELHLLKGDSTRAAEYFEKAYADLSQDTWLVRNEPERLERIKELAGM